MPHLVSYPVPEDLSSKVKMFYRISDTMGAPYEDHIPPGRPILAVTLRGGWYIDSDAHEGLYHTPEAYVVGQITRPHRMRPDGDSVTFGILFAPTTLHRLFGVNMADARDTPLAVDSLGIAPLRDLAAAIRAAGSDEGRVRAASSALRQRRPGICPPSGTDGAIRKILASGGAISIAAVANELNVSVRTLERWFQREVGVSPKRYARIVRFVTAVGRMSRGTVPSWCALAEGLGYHDQAHFTRDFNAFAGMPPLAFMKRVTGFTYEAIEQRAYASAPEA